MELLNKYIEKIKKEPALLKDEEIISMLNASESKKTSFPILKIAAAIALLFTTYFVYDYVTTSSAGAIEQQIAQNDLRYTNLIQRISSNPKKSDISLVINYNALKERIPIDKSSWLSLSQNKLTQLGFSFEADKVSYRANVKGKGSLSFKLEKKNSVYFVSDDYDKRFNEYDFYPLYITDAEGKQGFRYKFTKEYLDKKKLFLKRINSLIPILIDIPKTKEKKVFWFLSTNKLLNILEQNVEKATRFEVTSVFTKDKDESKPTLNLYPNSARKLVKVEADFLDNTSQVKLFDITGKLIKILEPLNLSNNNQQKQFRLDGIEKGMYFISVSSKFSPEVTQRFIVTD